MTLEQWHKTYPWAQKVIDKYRQMFGGDTKYSMLTTEVKPMPERSSN